jgi:Tol biopolymer transport system component
MVSMRLSSVCILGLFLLACIPVAHGVYVPYSEEYGIYLFDMESSETRLVYSSPLEITNIDLSPDESMFAICLYHGDGYEYSEIYTMNVDGSHLTRLTNNTHWDLYPNWSPDGSEFLFLSWRNTTLDIYKMDADGGNQRLLYDSGGHDSDIDWVGDRIAFTRDSQIWMMNSDGTEATQLTDPLNAGVWGDAVLPFGDYDPRISPDGSLVVFERLVNDTTVHGNYELYVIDVDGENEHNITGTRWTQGIAQWSSTGEELIYLVSAMGLEGRYDLFRINVDGTGTTDLTSDLFPPGFLSQHPIYAGDDSSIYFVGQWWDWNVLDTSLTCIPSTSVVTLEESVTFTGSLQPEVRGTEYWITSTSLTGQVTNTTLSSEDGSYSYGFTPEATGEYTVQAGWNGDKGHHPSVSPSVLITVQEEVVPQNPGIPGFPLHPIAAGLALYILSKRRTRT